MSFGGRSSFVDVRLVMRVGKGYRHRTYKRCSPYRKEREDGDRLKSSVTSRVGDRGKRIKLQSTEGRDSRVSKTPTGVTS